MKLKKGTIEYLKTRLSRELWETSEKIKDNKIQLTRIATRQCELKQAKRKLQSIVNNLSKEYTGDEA